MCSQPEEGALARRIAIYNLCKLGLQKEVKGVRDPAGSRGVWWEETEADQQPGGGWGRLSGARPRSLASRSALPPKHTGRPLNRRRPGLIYRREVSIREGRIFLSLSTLPQPGGYNRSRTRASSLPSRASGGLREMVPPGRQVLCGSPDWWFRQDKHTR